MTTADARSEQGAATLKFNAAALLAAGLMIGFGTILWIAANWDAFGKEGRFALVGSALAASAALAMFQPKLRVAASLSGVLAIGALLALFGQTYQSGADPWQLFALWAAVALPWAVAARHDSVWVLWVTVALTALTLWAAVSGRGPLGFIQPSVVFPVWLLAISGALLLSPAVGLSRYIGTTTWAFRLAVIAAAGFIVAGTLPAIFERSGSNAVVIAGFALMTLTVFALTKHKPFELGLLALATLTLDVLVIAAIMRAVLYEGLTGSEIGPYFLVGILSAGIVAASAAWLLRVARSNDGAPLQLEKDADAQSRNAAVLQNGDAHARTWPVIVMSGIGALIAAVPMLVFFYLTFGAFLEYGLGPYILGGIAIASVVALLPSAQPLSFGQQLGVITLVLGMLLVGFGLYRDMSDTAASLLMMALAMALAFRISTGWIDGLLGAAAAVFAAMAVGSAAAMSHGFIPLHDQLGWIVVATVGAALLLARRLNGDLDWLTRYAPADQFLTGFLIASLAGIIATAGSTFLLGSAWWSSGGTTGRPLAGWIEWNWASLFSVALCAAGLGILYRLLPQVRTMTGYAVAAILVVFSVLMTTLGAPIFVLAAAVTSSRRALAGFAAFATLWVIGTFYYWLGWPLLDKAYLVIVLGIVLAAIVWFDGFRLPRLPENAAKLAPLAPPAPLASLAPAMIAIATLSTAAIVGNGIWQKERVIRTGRTIFMELAPVDPRSLMQGDYMALRFAMPQPPENAQDNEPQHATHAYAIATVDGRRVAQIKSISASPPVLAADEIQIAVVSQHGQWGVGTNAWYFKEGTGQKYEAARFGEFRITTDGEAVLVGLANADLQALR